jgi:uncharacterized protein (TIGR04255 family)
MENLAIPKRLRKEPLLEAIWEIRFTSDIGSVEELLPGLIYSELRSEFTKTETLPVKSLPQELIRNDPNLKYMPSVKLHGTQYDVQIGNHVLALNCRLPYPGWERFELKINELSKIVQNTGLISKPERFSLKYIDLISFDDSSMSGLNVSVRLGDITLSDKPIQLRTEIHEGDFTSILQVLSPVKAVVKDGTPKEGILVDIDTIYLKNDFWNNQDTLLNTAHSKCKYYFFELLKKETWDLLGAEY